MVTVTHPTIFFAFLQLGNTLSDCAKKYKGFCHRYKSQTKPPRKCHWGSKILRGQSKPNSTTSPSRSKQRTTGCQVTENPEVERIVRQFVDANRAPSESEKVF
ncbi:MAG: hypothetical protein AAFV71_21255 [Cyanobacteria bacterium J06633_8]